MKVTLAYPFEGRQSDETVDLDEPVARQMVRDGLARLPDVTGDSTVEQLRAYADAAGINLAGVTRKADIIAAIEAAESTPEPEGA